MLTKSSSAVVSTHPLLERARNEPSRAVQMIFGSPALSGTPMYFDQNSEIFGENEPADYIYKVLSGTVRTYKVLNDGRRQVGGFYLPGDVFGLDVGDVHSFSAEAITDACVLVVRRSAVTTQAARDPEVAHGLWIETANELRRTQNHLMLLIKTAQERVAAFLLEMADRSQANGAIELPMSRQDIADYLGLTIETVSRTLTLFETSAAIALPRSRRIVLRNRSALNRLNS